MRLLGDGDLPFLHGLSALFMSLEALEQLFALLDSLISINMGVAANLLHQLEVGSHRLGESGHLTQLWNKHDPFACLLVVVNQHWLVVHLHLPAILLSEVVHVGDARRLFVFSCILLEGVEWTQLKVHIVDPVGSLVVACQHSLADDLLTDLLLNIPSCLVSDVVDEL